MGFETLTRPLVLTRVGFLRSELRVFLRTEDLPTEDYVVQLEGVEVFYDNLHRGVPVRIYEYDVGSFGYWLASSNCRTLAITTAETASLTSELGSLVAVAKRVVYRNADGEAEAKNWPA